MSALQASHDIPIIEAERLLACHNNLGEGVVWDSKTQLLHWVDITASEVHSFDPTTSAHSVDKYPESHCLTYITPHQSEPGLIATLAGSLVVLPPATVPSALSSSSSSPGSGSTEAATAAGARPESKLSPSEPEINIKQSLRTLAQPLNDAFVEDKTIRFNDGGVDPKGRVFYGSMGNDEESEVFLGELWRYDPDGTNTKIFDQVGVSNGLGWSPDGGTMYYIDSRKDEIRAYSYDLSTGLPSSPRVFATTPPPLDPSSGKGTEGIFDGLCVDGVGNVWAARWRDERVAGFSPKGEIIAFISVKGVKNVTIPCFGGKTLETMYITTASSHLGGKGDDALYPHSGDLFTVDFRPGSRAREIVERHTEGKWTGAERHRAGL